MDLDIGENIDSSINHEPGHFGRTLAEIKVIHREFWRGRAERQERQLADEDLVKEAFADLLELAELKVPFHKLRSFDMLLDRTEKRLTDHRARFLGEVRQENGRRGGKARKSDALQRLIDEIVARTPTIDCSTLLQRLKIREKLGIIEDIDEDEISFSAANGRSKSIRVTSLKDRLYRARKKVESQKAVSASRP